MPSPLDHADKFNFIDKKTVNTPYGPETQWVDGADFDCLLTKVGDTEAMIAERKDNIKIFTGMVDKALPVEKNTVFKRKSDGKTFRITSDPTDDETPEMATFQVKYFTAEEWALPKE